MYMYVQWLTDFAQAVSQPSPALLHHCLCQNPSLSPAVLNIHVGKQKIIMPRVHVHVHVVSRHLTLSGLAVSVTFTHPGHHLYPLLQAHLHMHTHVHTMQTVYCIVGIEKKKKNKAVIDRGNMICICRVF